MLTPLHLRAVTYAAVAATLRDDFRRYPPPGYRALESRVRLGHGDARWHHAWTETMTLGLQRRAGLEVERFDSPAEVRENSYDPVTFDADGTPVAPATLAEGEDVFVDTGAQVVRPGDSAVLGIGSGPLGFRAPVRVVAVVDEPTLRGVVLGSLPGHPVSGEEAFLVEQREDGSVWLTVRAFSRPAHPALWAIYPLLRLTQAIITSRLERALARPLPR